MSELALTHPDGDPQAVPVERVKVGDRLALATPVEITAVRQVDGEDGVGTVLTVAGGESTPPIPAGSEVLVLRAD